MKRPINTCIWIVVATMLLMFAGGCKKDNALPVFETGEVMDVDSNMYKTVKIGNQWWMMENLKVTKYRDGSAIELLESDTALWNNNTTGAYCAGGFGLLYNWYAVNSQSHNICPAGWHIPTDAEWKQLEAYLGMDGADADKTGWRGSNEGDKLKITGVDNWKRSGDAWATNESGFTALAGNCRMFDGTSGQPFGSYYTGFWWTASENTTNNNAWYRYLDHQKSNVFRFYGPKTYGFSVRCVND